ncbi:hypothetical protein C0J52_02837 [Blattella germanica]|nr:hypothetical protein C0J52_02837 [Blattella germanica]
MLSYVLRFDKTVTGKNLDSSFLKQPRRGDGKRKNSNGICLQTGLVLILACSLTIISSIGGAAGKPYKGSASSPAPFDWPPRNPDLVTPDNALRGFIKEQVRNTRLHTLQELRAAVECAFTLVTPEDLRKTFLKTWLRI